MVLGVEVDRLLPGSRQSPLSVAGTGVWAKRGKLKFLKGLLRERAVDIENLFHLTGDEKRFQLKQWQHSEVE